jgi:hypothetical protein
MINVRVRGQIEYQRGDERHASIAVRNRFTWLFVGAVIIEAKKLELELELQRMDPHQFRREP